MRRSLANRSPARQHDKSQLPRPFFLLWRRLYNRRTATSRPLSDLFGNSVSKSVKCVQGPLVELESRSPSLSGGSERARGCFGHGEIAAGASFAVRLRSLQQSHEHAQSNERRSVLPLCRRRSCGGQRFPSMERAFRAALPISECGRSFPRARDPRTVNFLQPRGLGRVPGARDWRGLAATADWPRLHFRHPLKDAL